MVKCDKCSVETFLPYRCSYCGGNFCDEHRLPELHNCSGAFKQSRNTVSIGSYSSSSNPYGGSYSSSRVMRPYWFSHQELKDLALGLAVILFSPLIRLWEYLFIIPFEVIAAMLILTSAFILHELAHKFAAQRLGLWAEFRISIPGMFLTLLSFLLVQTSIFPVMFVAPGAVMIAGMLRWDEYGKVSIAGPATNIAQAIIFFLIFLFTSNYTIADLAIYGIAVNSGLALFNLIPFGIFDGMKIFKWSWRVWLLSVILAGSLFVFVWF
jgi:Zn-dependent protease